MTGEFFVNILPVVLALAIFALFFIFRGKHSKVSAWFWVVLTFIGCVWLGWFMLFVDGLNVFRGLLMLFFLAALFQSLKELNALRTREP